MELHAEYAPKVTRFTVANSLFFYADRGTMSLPSRERPATRLRMQRTRYPERRRTTRLSLQIPLTVRCRLPEGETIDLKASTYIVSANGALILMDTPLFSGQTVKVINEHTAKSIDCVVTSLREKRERRFVGVAFTTPDVDFWHIVFPKSGTRQAIRSSQTGALMPPGIRSDTSQQF
jgi:hypothetical protein